MIRPTVGGGGIPMLRSSWITVTRLPDRAAVVGRLDRSPVMAHSTSRTRGSHRDGPVFPEEPGATSALGRGPVDFHPKRVMTATMPGATFRSVVYAFGPPRLELSGRQYAGRNSDGRPGVAILRRLGEAGHAKLGDRSYLVRRGDDDPGRRLPGSRRAGGTRQRQLLPGHPRVPVPVRHHHLGMDPPDPRDRGGAGRRRAAGGVGPGPEWSGSPWRS